MCLEPLLTWGVLSNRHPLFSRTLELERADVASARLYIVGLGIYEAWIDGQKVGNEYLAPGAHAHDKWIQYQTYDVTDQVADGAKLVVALGHGWYSGRFGFVKTDHGYYGNDWRLIGELLQDGNFYRENLRTAKSEYWYTSDGKEHTLWPILTFFGYRYAKIEVDGVAPADFDPADFIGIALYSDFDAKRGRITTGHARVNQLISNARWGMKDNFLDTATDCPQRDERMGWTGDANVFSRTALLMASPYAFYRKYLYDMAREQVALDGAVPMVVPSFGLPGAPAVWGDATTFIPWNMYELDGDPAILAEHYEAMRGYVDWVVAQDGDNHALLGSMQLGDWLALDTKDPKGRQGYTDGPFIAYLYLWKSARIVA